MLLFSDSDTRKLIIWCCYDNNRLGFGHEGAAEQAENTFSDILSPCCVVVVNLTQRLLRDASCALLTVWLLFGAGRSSSGFIKPFDEHARCCEYNQVARVNCDCGSVREKLLDVFNDVRTCSSCVCGDRTGKFKTKLMFSSN